VTSTFLEDIDLTQRYADTVHPLVDLHVGGELGPHAILARPHLGALCISAFRINDLEAWPYRSFE
jgi:hypothetical protein